MNALLLKLVNMSLTAGWLVLAVVLLRLALKKAPKWLHCALWGLVALRLVLPFSLESALSLIPSADPLPQAILQNESFSVSTGVAAVDTPVNGYLAEHYAPGVTVAHDAGSQTFGLLTALWLAGVAAMLLYALISALRLRRQVGAAIETAPRVRICDELQTPFIFGIFRPCIYLPSRLTAAQQASILAHERAHLQRHDHWWKPLGFLLLSVYWFNPALWVAYILLCRDIEFACDEKVLRGLTPAQVADYSQALLDCSAPRSRVAACPLAFGEVGVRQRIKAALHYKKPAFWIILIALAVSAAAAVCLLTNPPALRDADQARTYAVEVPHGGFVDHAQIHLFPAEQRATFSFSYLGSTIIDGPFEESAGKLTVHDAESGRRYVFQTKDGGDSYRFDAAASAAVTSYRYGEGQQPESALPDGTVFWRTVNGDQNLQTLLRDTVAAEDRDAYYGEALFVGLVQLGAETRRGVQKVYALVESAAFEQRTSGLDPQISYFVDAGGHLSPAVFTIDLHSGKVEVQYPEDGAYYTSSIKRMFPREIRARIFDQAAAETDRTQLWQQCTAQAEDYLKAQGRTATVCREGEAHTLIALSQYGISDDALDKIFKNIGSLYPDFVGSRRVRENGTETIYEARLDGNTVSFLHRTLDGEILEINSFPRLEGNSDGPPPAQEATAVPPASSATTGTDVTALAGSSSSDFIETATGRRYPLTAPEAQTLRSAIVEHAAGYGDQPFDRSKRDCTLRLMNATYYYSSTDGAIGDTRFGHLSGADKAAFEALLAQYTGGELKPATAPPAATVPLTTEPQQGVYLSHIEDADRPVQLPNGAADELRGLISDLKESPCALAPPTDDAPILIRIDGKRYAYFPAQALLTSDVFFLYGGAQHPIRHASQIANTGTQQSLNALLRSYLPPQG